MWIDDRDTAAMRGDMGLEACAIRLMAARASCGFSQQRDLVAEIGIKPTSYNNMERGLSYPSREVMRYFYRAHRIDFNFMMNGDWPQLPSDVIERLFAALPGAHSEWDRKEGSGSTRIAALSSPPKK